MNEQSTAGYPEALRILIGELKRLPGIGPRSAERIALWLVQSKDAHPAELAGALTQVAETVQPCGRCGFFSTGPLCTICLDHRRAGEILCVVERATDIVPLERSGVFKGRYHALGGRLSPLDGVGPEELSIKKLLERVKTETPSEVILALSADVEGEATAHYLVGILRESGVRITRIAHGLPVGGGLEQADDLTLGRAMNGRQIV